MITVPEGHGVCLCAHGFCCRDRRNRDRVPRPPRRRKAAHVSRSIFVRESKRPRGDSPSTRVKERSAGPEEARGECQLTLFGSAFPKAKDVASAANEKWGQLIIFSRSLDFGFRLEGQVNNDIMQVSPLCVIDQRYSGVDWPLDCRGNLASGSGADCKLDVAMIAQQIIENEAKQQIQDAVEEKAGSFIKKIFGG